MCPVCNTTAKSGLSNGRDRTKRGSLNMCDLPKSTYKVDASDFPSSMQKTIHIFLEAKGRLENRIKHRAPMFTICCSFLAQLGLLQGNLVGLGGGIRWQCRPCNRHY